MVQQNEPHVQSVLRGARDNWQATALACAGPQREAAADQALSAVGMSGYRDRYPHELSGGIR
jgi:ABC-type nitrate/sulfonate/bicarbonate transport system ATPase subunit